MDRFYHQQVDQFVETFKKEVKKNFVENSETEFNRFVDNYDSFKIVSKIKQKTTIPMSLRCVAKRLNCDQCTRRRNKISAFCGTHFKSRPFGVFDVVLLADEDIVHLISVFTQEIQGIIYHLDENLNVYDTGDILNDVRDPKILTKAVLIDGIYTIPAFGLL
jgi:hypothetical protein